MIVFAGIEFSRVNMIRNSCENAAFEGARKGVVPGATADECRAEAQRLLDILGVNESTIGVSPSVITDDTPEVTVTVSVPLNAANGYALPKYFVGMGIDKSIMLKREGVSPPVSP